MVVDSSVITPTTPSAGSIVPNKLLILCYMLPFSFLLTFVYFNSSFGAVYLYLLLFILYSFSLTVICFYSILSIRRGYIASAIVLAVYFVYAVIIPTILHQDEAGFGFVLTAPIYIIFLLAFCPIMYYIGRLYYWLRNENKNIFAWVLLLLPLLFIIIPATCPSFYDSPSCIQKSALESSDPEICLSSGPGDFDNCIFAVALKSNNASLCMWINSYNSPQIQFECIKYFSSRANDSLCTVGTSPGGHVRDTCYSAFAEIKSNVSLCSNIEDAQVKSDCISSFKK